MNMTLRVILIGSTAGACLASPVSAATLGAVTITDAHHFGYFGFASTSANNTKVDVGPFSGVVRTIRVEGTITKVHPDAWLRSIRVYPSGSTLAGYQPWFQFSREYDFAGTRSVSGTIYAPGGVDLSQSLQMEMYSIDSESFVPGLDATSTLTYTFDSEFPVGTAEYSGAIEPTDPTFNRPIQFETNPPGYTTPFLSSQFPHYDVQPFHVASPGSYTLVSANEYESAGVLYADEFDPLSPLDHVVRALGQTGNVLRNDSFSDLPFGDDATGGTVITADLLPAVQYYFVTTAYAAPGSPNDGGPFIGKYSNLITGAGRVSLGLVPEPSGNLLLLAVFGFAGWHRRRVYHQRGKR